MCFSPTVLLVIEVWGGERPEKWSKNLPASGFVQQFSLLRLKGYDYGRWCPYCSTIIACLIKYPIRAQVDNTKKYRFRFICTPLSLEYIRMVKFEIGEKIEFFHWKTLDEVCNYLNFDFMPTHTGQLQVLNSWRFQLLCKIALFCRQIEPIFI